MPPRTTDPQAQSDPQATELVVSRGFGAWLVQHRLSLAFSCYQSGQLFMVGMLPNGSVSFNQQNFTRAMGLCWQPGRLYLGGLDQVWRLENMLRPGEIGNDAFDQVLVPRKCPDHRRCRHP